MNIYHLHWTWLQNEDNDVPVKAEFIFAKKLIPIVDSTRVRLSRVFYAGSVFYLLLYFT